MIELISLCLLSLPSASEWTPYSTSPCNPSSYIECVPSSFFVRRPALELTCLRHSPQEQILSPCFLLLHLLFHSVVSSSSFDAFLFEESSLIFFRFSSARSPSSIVPRSFKISPTAAKSSSSPTLRCLEAQLEVSRVSFSSIHFRAELTLDALFFAFSALANMLSYADLAGPVAILANPFADQVRRVFSSSIFSSLSR